MNLLPALISGLKAALALGTLGLATSVAAENYIPDTEYHHGRLTEDAFAMTPAADYVGQKHVQLSNGDIIVAGIVPPLSGDANFGAIGLLRRTSSGERIAWANPGAYGNYNDEYVIYPGTDYYRIKAIKDIVQFNNNLYVLTDTQNESGFAQSVRIYIFGLDGSFKGAQNFMLESSVDYTRNVWGSGLVAFSHSLASPDSTKSLAVIGRKLVDGKEKTIFSRFTIQNDGSLDVTPTNESVLTNTLCGASDHCSAFGIALGGRPTLASPPRIYYTGTFIRECDPPGAGFCFETREAFFARIDLYGTSLDISSGAYSASNTKSFLEGKAYGRAIAVQPSPTGITPSTPNHDKIFIAAEIEFDSSQCKRGAYVMAYRLGETMPYTLGGVTTLEWTKAVGGEAKDGSFPCPAALIAKPHFVPTALAIQDNHIAVAGYSSKENLCAPAPCTPPEDTIDGSVAVLQAITGDMVSGSTGSNRTQPVLYPYHQTAESGRTRHSGFHDISPSGNGRFSLSGDIRYTATESENVDYRGKRQFTTFRIANPNPEGFIFLDGFED